MMKTLFGPEFEKDIRKTAVMVIALYGLKSAGTAFSSHLATCKESLRYESCNADRDLWLESEIRPEYQVQYYFYLLCFVDDNLCIHHNADNMLQQLHKPFPLKLGFGNPDMYLGAKLHKTQLHNCEWEWAISPVKYVCEAVRNGAVHLAANFAVGLGYLRSRESI